MKIINTVDTLRALTSTQIERLFYSSQQAQSHRCKQLVDHRKLKRFRENNWTPYIYYLGRRPAQLKSILAISEFYTLCMVNNLNVTYIEREKRISFNNDEFIIVPDAVITIESDGVEYEFFIEVDNTKELSTNKYYRAFKEYGFIPPPIVSISNRRRRNVFSELEVIKLKMDLSDFSNIFLQYF
jgi:hypothetical protein